MFSFQSTTISISARRLSNFSRAHTLRLPTLKTLIFVFLSLRLCHKHLNTGWNECGKCKKHSLTGIETESWLGAQIAAVQGHRNRTFERERDRWKGSAIWSFSSNADFPNRTTPEMTWRSKIKSPRQKIKFPVLLRAGQTVLTPRNNNKKQTK